MKSPIKYFGGKNGMSNKIIEQFPDLLSYKTYLEPYGGSAAILLSSPLGHVEIYNDIYENVYSVFKCLADNDLFEKFKFKCDISFYSEQYRKDCKDKLKQSNLSIVDRAFYFWYINRTSYNGVGGLNVMKIIRRGMSKSTSDFLSSVDRLKEIHDRLSAVIILNQDAIELIKKTDAKDVFMYLDPPYHLSTRSGGGYVHDYTDEDHDKLISCLLNIKGKVLLSGYDCEAYDKLKGKFKKHIFNVCTLDKDNNSRIKEEVLWRNY